jgi:hypothetical protein
MFSWFFDGVVDNTNAGVAHTAAVVSRMNAKKEMLRNKLVLIIPLLL